MWFILIVVQKYYFDPCHQIESSGLVEGVLCSIFKVKQSMLKAWRFVGPSCTIYTMTQCNISEDLKLQQHCRKRDKPRPNVARIFLELEWVDENIGVCF